MCLSPTPTAERNAGRNNTERLNRLIKMFVVPGLILAVMVMFAFVPSMLKALSNFVQMDSHGMREIFGELGVKGPLISIFLMTAQAIFSPLPSLAITLANAYVFGWLYGAAISWAGTLIGASICFGLARLYGRPVVEKLVGPKSLNKSFRFFKRYGTHTIIICRLLPFVPMDPVSYIAGLTGMKFSTFLWATAISQIPVLMMYSYFGENLPNVVRLSKLFLLLIFQYPSYLDGSIDSLEYL